MKNEAVGSNGQKSEEFCGLSWGGGSIIYRLCSFFPVASGFGGGCWVSKHLLTGYLEH